MDNYKKFYEKVEKQLETIIPENHQVNVLKSHLLEIKDLLFEYRNIDDYELLDPEYLGLLLMMRKNLDSIKEVKFENSDFPKHEYTNVGFGKKYALSNIGFCNKDYFITNRKGQVKRLKDHQRCPLDMRKEIKDVGLSCFLNCKLFQKNLTDIEEIKKLYDEQIKYFKEEMRKKSPIVKTSNTLIKTCKVCHYYEKDFETYVEGYKFGCIMQFHLGKEKGFEKEPSDF